MKLFVVNLRNIQEGCQRKAVGNSKLAYNKACHFAIVPMMAAYGDPEDANLLLYVTDHSNKADKALNLLKKEVAELNIIVEFCEIEATDYLAYELMLYVGEGDYIYADVSAGDPNWPLAVDSMIRFGYDARVMIAVGCVAYAVADKICDCTEKSIQESMNPPWVEYPRFIIDFIM